MENKFFHIWQVEVKQLTFRERMVPLKVACQFYRE